MRKSALDVFEEAVAARRAEEWQKGWAEGWAEGKLESLLRVGHNRFGPPPPAVHDRLQALTLPQVDRMIDRMLHATCWEEVLIDA